MCGRASMHPRSSRGVALGPSSAARGRCGVSSTSWPSCRRPRCCWCCGAGQRGRGSWIPRRWRAGRRVVHRTQGRRLAVSSFQSTGGALSMYGTGGSGILGMVATSSARAAEAVPRAPRGCQVPVTFTQVSAGGAFIPCIFLMRGACVTKASGSRSAPCRHRDRAHRSSGRRRPPWPCSARTLRRPPDLGCRSAQPSPGRSRRSRWLSCPASATGVTGSCSEAISSTGGTSGLPSRVLWAVASASPAPAPQSSAMRLNESRYASSAVWPDGTGSGPGLSKRPPIGPQSRGALCPVPRGSTPITSCERRTRSGGLVRLVTA